MFSSLPLHYITLMLGKNVDRTLVATTARSSIFPALAFPLFGIDRVFRYLKSIVVPDCSPMSISWTHLPPRAFTPIAGVSYRVPDGSRNVPGFFDLARNSCIVRLSWLGSGQRATTDVVAGPRSTLFHVESSIKHFTTAVIFVSVMWILEALFALSSSELVQFTASLSY